MICNKPISEGNVSQIVCGAVCRNQLTLRVKDQVRQARDVHLIDPEEYYQAMKVLNQVA
mgnify:FL=1